MSQQGKPNTLEEMKTLAHSIDADTACFSAGTDAANFGVLFQQLLYELHLG